jgi:hypothetical protein
MYKLVQNEHVRVLATPYYEIFQPSHPPGSKKSDELY